MKSKLLFLLIAHFLYNGSSMSAQDKMPGPVIKNFGAVWEIPNVDFATDKTMEFKVVFDIMNSADSLHQLNKSIETAARFLNMHVREGVQREQLHVALVVHNKATKDIITDKAYQQRFGMDNPNSELVKELLNENVKIILCGQSSYSRDYPIEDTIDGVQMALSAMTAILQLEEKGYKLIKF